MAGNPLVRKWLLGWLFFVAFGHVVIALGVTWFADLPVFAHYHQSILTAFGIPQQWQTEQLQLWWISLFGATLQSFALCLLVLLYLANRYRLAHVWLLTAVIILLWAPQDIYISLKKDIWSHLWVDLAAVAALVPPLLILWWQDRKPVQKL